MPLCQINRTLGLNFKDYETQTRYLGTLDGADASV